MKILIGTVVLLILGMSLYAIAQSRKSRSIEAFKHYARLGFDTIRSANYELVKMTELGPNNITDQVRFLPTNQTFVFNAGLCSYWRLNAKGQLLGSYGNSSPIHACGVFFHNDYFVDWALTGHTEHKQYKAIIKGETLSKAQFENHYKAAEVVVYKNRFLYDPDQSFGHCFMKIQGDWIQIISEFPESDHEGDYFEAARLHIMHGYPIKNEDPFIKVENTIMPFYDWDDESEPIHLIKHKRRKRIRRPLMSIDVNNNHRPDGWEATGFFHINIEEDTLQFQAYCYEKTQRLAGFNTQMSLYQLPALPHLAFLLVEEGRGDRAKEETGLYVLQKIDK